MSNSKRNLLTSSQTKTEVITCIKLPTWIFSLLKMGGLWLMLIFIQWSHLFWYCKILKCLCKALFGLLTHLWVFFICKLTVQIKLFAEVGKSFPQISLTTTTNIYLFQLLEQLQAYIRHSFCFKNLITQEDKIFTGTNKQ